MADDAARQEAMDALARQVVADVSPAELPLFDATADRYRADSEGTLAASSDSDEPLGFGVETAIVLLAPFALEFVKGIFTRIAQKAGDGATDAIAHRISKLFGGAQPEPAGPAPLTPEQLALVDEAAREEARHLKLPPDRAKALADGVVAALATRT